MEQESKETNRDLVTRTHIWKPSNALVDYEVTEEYQEKILQEFIRKTECMKTNKIFVPNLDCDSFLAPYYKPAFFDIASRSLRREYFEPFKAQRLRI
ncbi:hypothetical protein PAEPH01_2419, partial [Pancytospora epiphaga]